MFLIRITSRVDLATSACPSVRMNAEISVRVNAVMSEAIIRLSV